MLVACRALVVGLGRRGQFGVLPGAGQPVLLLTASLLTAPELFGEVRSGTVVRPDYGGYCCVACVLPRSDETRGPGPRSRIRCLWTRLTAESPPSVFTSLVVVTTSSRTEFPTESTFRTVLLVSLLSSGRARVGRRRQGGSRGPRS
ncbi:hypothetical protein Taro_025931 [Colocasia esculenta]|uniref:Uncharacterized protein n=1 Tax=Colocasia esculenta TaxID=4460 RepID=A0A843VBI5_COLES|nr:hypothetical protein [Colocasia esculenta]